jgi:hypothetical protein
MAALIRTAVGCELAADVLRGASALVECLEAAEVLERLADQYTAEAAEHAATEAGA